MTTHKRNWFKVGTTVRRMEIFDFVVVDIPIKEKQRYYTRRFVFKIFFVV